MLNMLYFLIFSFMLLEFFDLLFVFNNAWLFEEVCKLTVCFLLLLLFSVNLTYGLCICFQFTFRLKCFYLFSTDIKMLTMKAVMGARIIIILNK